VPQRRETWPETLKFLVRRRTGQKNLESVFVTVFEPYKKTPFIESVRALPVESDAELPVALEIRCGGKTHLLFNRIESDAGTASSLTLPGGTVINARAAVLERSGDGFDKVYLLDDSGSRISGSPQSAPMIQTAVAQVDYAKAEITLDKPLLSKIPPAGNTAIISSKFHANAVAVARVISESAFSVGDDDLCAGTVRITSAQGNRIFFEPRYIYFVEPGMTAVNEAGEAVGRVRTIKEGIAELSGKDSYSLEDFPDTNGDGRRTCRFAVVGPGDRVILHSSVRLPAKEQ
jgi:hypothetical protein